MKAAANFQGQVTLVAVSAKVQNQYVAVTIEADEFDDIVIECYRKSQRERFVYSHGDTAAARWTNQDGVIKALLTLEQISATACLLVAYTVESQRGLRLIKAKSVPLRPELDSDDDTGSSLLAVRPDEKLGGLLWELDFEEGPLLLVQHSADLSYTAVLRNPMFVAAVIPEVVRQVVNWLPVGLTEKREVAEAWLRLFAKYDISASSLSDPDRVADHAARCASGFATDLGLLRGIEGEGEQ